MESVLGQEKDKNSDGESEDQNYGSSFKNIFSIFFKKNTESFDSHFKSNYLQQMGIQNPDFEHIPPVLDSPTANLLAKLNISYHPLRFFDFDVQFYQKTKFNTIMELKVNLGYFTLTLIVLNNQPSISLDKIIGYSKVNEGGFGKVVYKNWEHGRIDGKDFVYNDQGDIFQFTKKVAVFDHQGKKINFQIFHQAILEYCFCKLTFALGIGPKIELMFGFDMICYQNCSFFFMEQCKAINGKYIPQTLDEVLTQIKQSLKLMHSLKIIHNDIKSENIMYSPHHKKVVFIDFGITQLVRQKLGRKTQTSFKGSYHYVSDEMKSLFMSKIGLVDLYWNDLYSLKKTMETLKFLFVIDTHERSQDISKNTSSYEFYKFNENYVYIGEKVPKIVESFDEYTNMFEGNNLMENRQDANISKFDIMETQIISYQLFYLLYIKKIDEFKGCISPRNYITHSQRVHLMGRVIEFLEEIKQCPLYYELHYQNYSNFKAYQQYDHLMSLGDLETNFSYAIHDQSERLPSQSRKLQISTRYEGINYQNPQKHKTKAIWVPLFSLLVQDLVKSKHNQNSLLSICQTGQITHDLSELQHLNSQNRNQICNLFLEFTYASFISKQFKAVIAIQMFRLFKAQILKIFHDILFDQSKNQSSEGHQKTHADISDGPTRLQNAKNEFFKKQNSRIKQSIKDHLKMITSEGNQLNLQDKKFKKDIQHLVFTIELKFVQKYIYRKELIQMIKDERIFIHTQSIHYRLKDIKTEQCIRLIIMINFIKNKSFQDAMRVVKEIQLIFDESYRIEAKLYGLLSIMKESTLQLSYTKNIQILKQIKETATIVKQRLSQDNQKGLFQNRRKIVDIIIFTNVQSSEGYIDFMIECLQLQVLVNKGMADYNCRQIQQRVDEAFISFKVLFPNGATNDSLRQQELNMNILKIMIKQQMKCHQECYELTKNMYQLHSKGMNKEGIGPVLLYKCYFELGLQQKRVTSNKQYQFDSPNRIKQKINTMAKNKNFGFSFSRLVTKEKIELMFLERFKNLSFEDFEICREHFYELVSLIKNINYDSTIAYAGIISAKVSLTLNLFKMVHQMEVKCLQNLAFQQLKFYIHQAIKQGDQHNFQQESLLILNEIVQTMIELLYQYQKPIKSSFIEHVFKLYQKVSFDVLRSNSQPLPASYWIIKIMHEQNYSSKLSNSFEKIQTELLIIRTLELNSQVNHGFKHLQFLMIFVSNINFISKYQVETESQFISKVVAKVIKTLIETKRQHLFFTKQNFTINSLMYLYHSNQVVILLSMAEQLIIHINKFPGQKIVDKFCTFYGLLQSLQMTVEYLEILTNRILTVRKYSFEEYAPLVLYVLNKALSLEKIESDLLSVKHLKSFTINFHKLSRYLKSQFQQKYFVFFLNYFSKLKKQKQKKQISFKLMRIPIPYNFQNQKNISPKSWLEKIDQINADVKKVSIFFYGHTYQRHKQNLVQQTIISKINHLLEEQSGNPTADDFDKVMKQLMNNMMA